MTVTRDLRASLASEACLDVAVFALVMARKWASQVNTGGTPARGHLAATLPTEWAMAARVLLIDETSADEADQLRRALKGLL